MPGKGEKIAGRGWPARKFYLSPEAISLVEKHCTGTPLTMSAYIDALIKRDLDPQVVALREAYEKAGGFDGLVKRAKVVEPPAVAEERARKAGLDRGIAEARKTFTVPDGHEAVRDAEGRATGETRPIAKGFKLDV